MKLAIQGHVDRGKEIIQILESLGGINDGLHEGNNPDCYYELHGNIIWCVSTKGINFKYYTLEEFEKEFPFKIGDRVITITTNLKGIITNLKENGWYYVKCDNGHFVCIFGQHLKLYKEMKEERNITLTLEKAKEWYKKGGELKEIALQAFTEKELTEVGLPKTWEEFCKKYPIERGEFYITSLSEIHESTCSRNRCSDADKNVCSSQKSAEAHLAMIQLEKLRDCWRQGWKPKSHESVYTIKFSNNGLGVYNFTSREFLSFPTREIAEEFLKCFRNLIEKAGDLI